MLNGSNVWQKFNNLIMFPFKSCLWLSSFCPFGLNEGLYGLQRHVYGWRSCRVKLVRQGNEGAWMCFPICLMSHNKERQAQKHCAAKQQHSYRLGMPSQLSAWLMTSPPFSLSSHANHKLPGGESKTKRCRSWSVTTRGRRMRDWRLVHPTSAPSLLPVSEHSVKSSKQVTKHDYHLRSGGNTQDNNWLCVLSTPHLRNHLNVTEMTCDANLLTF